MAELIFSDYDHSDDEDEDEDYEPGVADVADVADEAGKGKGKGGEDDEDEEVRKGKLMRQIGLKQAAEQAAWEASDEDFVERPQKRPRP